MHRPHKSRNAQMLKEILKNLSVFRPLKHLYVLPKCQVIKFYKHNEKLAQLRIQWVVGMEGISSYNLRNQKSLNDFECWNRKKISEMLLPARKAWGWEIKNWKYSRFTRNCGIINKITKSSFCWNLYVSHWKT